MADQMKFCRKCGKQINADAAFCRFCGFRFDIPAPTQPAQAPQRPAPTQQVQAPQQPAPQAQPAQQSVLAAPKKKSLREQMKENYEAGKAKGQAFVMHGKSENAVPAQPVQPAQPIQAAPVQQPIQAMPVQQPIQAMPIQPAQSAAPATRFCNQCGKQISTEAAFCRYCGFRFDVIAQDAAPQTAVIAMPVQSAAPQEADVVAAAAAAAAPSAMEQLSARLGGTASVMAPANPGEIVCAAFSKAMNAPGVMSGVGAAASNLNAAASNARARAEQVLSPVQALLGGVKSFLSGIPAALRNPKALIPTVLLALAWIVLPMLQGGGSNAVVDGLSWLTFAGNGARREGLGLLGDIAGKGVVASVLASLFSGGIKSAAGGFGAILSRGEKGSVVLTALGAVFALALYLAFAGIETAGAGTAMAGIAGALAAVQSLGSRDGFLYSLAESLTAKQVNGVRTAQTGRIRSLLGGTALGFALFTVLSALDL
ncbi:MAG: zinc-ribbon domain-containing protein [Ruminococcaceae bacterium]|nr:zinc-ribbon domain-containing protein [Oscillospiraceae bacterium]